MIPEIVIDNAACKGHDYDEFYAEEKKVAVSLPVGHVCFRCPVINECREHGLKNEAYGVWGGMTERELHKARRHLGIPQPASGIGMFVMNGAKY